MRMWRLGVLPDAPRIREVVGKTAAHPRVLAPFARVRVEQVRVERAAPRWRAGRDARKSIPGTRTRLMMRFETRAVVATQIGAAGRRLDAEQPRELHRRRIAAPAILPEQGEVAQTGGIVEASHGRCVLVMLMG